MMQYPYAASPVRSRRHPDPWREPRPWLKALVGRDREKRIALAGAVDIAETTLRRLMAKISEEPRLRVGAHRPSCGKSDYRCCRAGIQLAARRASRSEIASPS